MDFKSIYQDWVDYSGGIQSAIANTTTDDLIFLDKDRIMMPEAGHLYLFDYNDYIPQVDAQSASSMATLAGLLLLNKE